MSNENLRRTLGSVTLALAVSSFSLLPMVSHAAALEGLDEMIARKSRHAKATWPTSTLEDTSNHFIWQPETLCYRDVVTGTEVWKLTQTKGGTCRYSSDFDRMPWSADGKYMSISTLGRPTQAFNNNGGGEWIWLITRTDGSSMRTPHQSPSRYASSGFPLAWSPQIPDTYYRRGSPNMGGWGDGNKYYRVTVSDTSVSSIPIISSGIYAGFTRTLSPDGKRALLTRSGTFSSLAIIPCTIYPDDAAKSLVPDGYPYFRDAEMSSYRDTPSFFDHAHSSMYKLLGPHGDWWYTIPSGSACRWKYKTTGSAIDGGPKWFGVGVFDELDPFYAASPNPHGTAYPSHGVPDRWGRYILHSHTESPYNVFGQAVRDMSTDTFLHEKYGDTWACHHSWGSFSDWFASSTPYFTSNNDRIIFTKYDDTGSEKVVCYTHTATASGGGRPEHYDQYPKPVQSPDGTKVGWHGDFLNGGTVTSTNSRVDVFWSVAQYPFPPTDLAATWVSGVKLTWLPPKYTQRGWPNEDTDPAPYAREIRSYHIWRAANQAGPWAVIGTVRQNYIVHDTYGLQAKTSDCVFADNPGDGTWYYAITSEEWSRLESRELSEILQVVVSGDNIAGSSVVQPKGRTGFWSEPPPAPLNFSYSPAGTPGHFRLTWTEPANDKIRYYNIYYSTAGSPQPVQQRRIASVPVGTSAYLDWLVDPTAPAFYTVTSVDRQGNESAPSGVPSDGEPPTVPDGLAAAAVDHSRINLTWNASSDNVGVIGYNIYRDDNRVSTAYSTSYTDTGLTPLILYTYTVTAFDASGNESAISAEVSEETLADERDTQPPSAPSELKAVAVSPTRINLTWTASSDNVGVIAYNVYRNHEKVATTPLSMSFSDGGLLPSTEYLYAVTALDAAGNESAESGEVTERTLAEIVDTQPPSIPTGLEAAAVGPDRINLTWNASSDDIGVVAYAVYRNGTKIGTATAIAYSDGGLLPSTSYTYTVTALDAAGNESAQSDAAIEETLSAPNESPVFNGGAEENVALNKDATATRSDYDTTPAMAVDGQAEGGSSWVAAGAPNSIIVDLGDDRSIAKIKVNPFNVNNNLYYYATAWNIKYATSAQPDAWLDFSGFIKNAGGGNLVGEGIAISGGNPDTTSRDPLFLTYDFSFAAVQARYVRFECIQGDGDGDANLNEIEIYSVGGRIPDQNLIAGMALEDVFDLDDYFSDPDGDLLTYSRSGGVNVAVVINAQNRVSLLSSPGWSGQETITFIAEDGKGGTAESNGVVVTVETPELPGPPGKPIHLH